MTISCWKVLSLKWLMSCPSFFSLVTVNTSFGSISGYKKMCARYSLLRG